MFAFRYFVYCLVQFLLLYFYVGREVDWYTEHRWLINDMIGRKLTWNISVFRCSWNLAVFTMERYREDGNYGISSCRLDCFFVNSSLVEVRVMVYVLLCVVWSSVICSCNTASKILLAEWNLSWTVNLLLQFTVIFDKAWNASCVK